MKRICLVAAGLVATTPILVHAAETSGALEEILVTAQRREQNLQEVPISVTAFSGEQLERSNVKSAVDYLAMTPNVSFSEDAQSGSRGIGISIRGVNNLVSGENAFVNSVGNYLDEFSVASVPNGVANPMLLDMERVEVLRGPQGTYFGRNSLGGALNLTSRAPTDKYEGEVSVGGEAYNHAGDMYNITGIFNAPFSSTFKIRGVAYYEKSTGLVKNIGPGEANSGHEYVNLRLRGVWDPTDSTKFGFTFIYSNEDQGTDENVPSGYLDLDTVDTFGLNPGVAFDPGTGFWPDNQNKLSHDLNEYNKLQTTVGIVNFAQKLNDQMTFKAVAGVIDATQKRLFDNDLIGNLDLLSRDNKYDGNSYSIEARLESKSSAIDWVVGALYAHDQQKQYNNVAISTDPTATIDGVGFLPPFPEGLGLARNTKLFKVDSAALFADATWHATDRLDLILGARYTSDDVLNSRTSYGIAPSCGCGPGDPAFFPSFVDFARPEASGKSKFNDTSPRAGLRFAWSDTGSVYATVSKGYKAGGDSTGNNTNAPGSPAVDVPFKAETLRNYELGIKTEFADRRIRLNASVFYLDWSNLQVEAFRFLTPGDLSSNFEQTVNVDSRGKGAELELLMAPMTGLTLGASLGYLDTEITKEPVCDVVGGPPTCIQITGGFTPSAVGLSMPKAPRHTNFVFGEYHWPVGTNSAWLRAEVEHRSSQYSDIEALTNLQTRGPSPNQGLTRVVGPDEFPYKVPAYDVVNMRFGYEWQRSAFNFYAENLFDEKYYTGTQENFGLSGIRLRPHPRVYGANVTFKF